MKVKGIVFDIGQTLVYYPFPLNWSALYRPAFENIAEKNKLNISEDEYTHIGRILSKYNTRIHPREIEVTSGQIFTEILSGTHIPLEYLDVIKKDFFSFFRNEAKIYADATDTLKALKLKGIVIGTLSDVAYGMDNSYALEDIRDVMEFIDIPFTSNDAGFRKPSSRGLKMLSEKMNLHTSEMMLVGDEKKDIECALNAGAIAILINRSGEERDFGQHFTIKCLTELLEILK